MHRHLLPAAPAPVRQRPAKVVSLEVRRKSRLEATTPKPPAPKAA